MEDIAKKTGKTDAVRKYGDMADLTMRSFNARFWNAEAGCLYDVVSEDRSDATLRPNQILAVSLTHSMLSKERAKSVVGIVGKELFTPFGLRSLSTADSNYRGRYEGDSVARDSSYHQGPVWAWLLGPFIDAYIQVTGNGRKTQTQARAWLHAFSAHLNDAGVGQVSEIFDGDSPHRARGCFAQAWSVAEILRAVVENGLVQKSRKTKKKVAAA
jgi:glycogen debranching enzyme